MRVIVCGGRDFNDWTAAHRELDKIHAETPITFLFHGNARGADTIADVWGRSQPRNCVRVFPVPAEWKRDGKAAGPLRNKRMLGNGIDLVIAFPGGAGTADMIKQSIKAGVKVVRPLHPA